MYHIYSSLSAFKLSWIKRIESYNEEECLSIRLSPCLNKLTLFGMLTPVTLKKKQLKTNFGLTSLNTLKK